MSRLRLVLEDHGHLGGEGAEDNEWIVSGGSLRPNRLCLGDLLAQAWPCGLSSPSPPLRGEAAATTNDRSTHLLRVSPVLPRLGQEGSTGADLLVTDDAVVHDLKVQVVLYSLRGTNLSRLGRV